MVAMQAMQVHAPRMPMPHAHAMRLDGQCCNCKGICESLFQRAVGVAGCSCPAAISPSVGHRCGRSPPTDGWDWSQPRASLALTSPSGCWGRCRRRPARCAAWRWAPRLPARSCSWCRSQTRCWRRGRTRPSASSTSTARSCRCGRVRWGEAGRGQWLGWACMVAWTMHHAWRHACMGKGLELPAFTLPSEALSSLQLGILLTCLPKVLQVCL